MTETVGDRLYKIRLACGDGTRKAMSLADFAKLVKRTTKADYDPSTISLLERMKQKWTMDNIHDFAAVDPLERGEPWLAFGVPAQSAPSVAMPDPRLDRVLNEQEEARAHRQAEVDRAAIAKRAAPEPKRRKGNGRA